MVLKELYRQREAVLPTADVLHDRAALYWQDVEIGSGNMQRLPRFQGWVGDVETALDRRRLITDHDKHVVGVRYWDDIVTADGIDRGVTTYVPHDEIRSGYPFSLVMDTAWYTGLEGHNDKIAETFMKELGVSVVVVGPEFTAAHADEIGAEMKLGKLAAMCTGFSQMRSMEASAEIYETLRANKSYYGLESDVIGVGESRGAMGEQIRRLYMKLLGIDTVHSDITDPCVSKQALQSKGDVLELLQWPIREAMSAVAVGAALLRSGDLRRQIDTVPLTARYHLGALLGTGPALLSGEEGMFADYTPLDHPQHITNFKSNSMAHTDDRRSNYENHNNTTIVELGGCHLGLAYPSVQRRIINRSHEIGRHLAIGVPLDWQSIHQVGHKSRQADEEIGVAA